MDLSSKTRFECEQQLFGFTSEFFNYCFEDHLLTDLISNSVEALVKSLHKKLISDVENPDELKINLKTFQENFMKKYKTEMSTCTSCFKKTVNNYLSIPDYVTLPENELPEQASRSKLNLPDLENEIKLLTRTRKCKEHLKRLKRKELKKTKELLKFRSNIKSRVNHVLQMDNKINKHNAEKLLGVLINNFKLINNN